MLLLTVNAMVTPAKTVNYNDVARGDRERGVLPYNWLRVVEDSGSYTRTWMTPVSGSSLRRGGSPTGTPTSTTTPPVRGESDGRHEQQQLRDHDALADGLCDRDSW